MNGLSKKTGEVTIGLVLMMLKKRAIERSYRVLPLLVDDCRNGGMLCLTYGHHIELAYSFVVSMTFGILLIVNCLTLPGKVQFHPGAEETEVGRSRSTA